MTLSRDETITCPSCRNEQTVVCYQSINASDDPPLTKRFLKGEINVFRCEACGFAAEIHLPLIVNCPSIGAMFLYCPTGWLHDDPKAVGEVYTSVAAQIDQFGAADSMIRTLGEVGEIVPVFSREELTSQYIFRDRLHEDGQTRPEPRGDGGTQPPGFLTGRLAALRARSKNPNTWIGAGKIVLAASILPQIELGGETIFYMTFASLLSIMGGYGMAFRQGGESFAYGWIKGILVWLVLFLAAYAGCAVIQECL